MRDATALCAMADSFLNWSLEFAGRRQTDMDGVFPLTSPLGQVSKSQLEDARRWWDEQGILDDGRPRICFVGSHSPLLILKRFIWPRKQKPMKQVPANLLFVVMVIPLLNCVQ